MKGLANISIFLLAAVASGCSDDSTPTDSGMPPADTGTAPTDTGVASDGAADTGMMATDSGPPPGDGAVPPQPTFPITAAFYYPWFPETWTVMGSHVSYQPTLGYYETTDAAVQTSHIDALGYAGMDVAISSWWGPGHYTDTRLGQLMNRTRDMGAPLKWAIYYEDEGTTEPSAADLAADLSYLRDEVATHEAFLRIDGKFVVFVYNANDTTCEVATRWSQANDTVGGAAYVVLKVFSGYRDCADQPESWHQYGPDTPADEQSGYSYTIAPGFWRADEASARLARDPARWQTNVADMAAATTPFKLVTTFNEWGEGTAVESAEDWSSASGYGIYLDALHEAFAP